MAKYLVIVESPKKTGYVKKFLGKDYDVVASCGSISKVRYDIMRIQVCRSNSVKRIWEIPDNRPHIRKGTRQ